MRYIVLVFELLVFEGSGFCDFWESVSSFYASRDSLVGLAWLKLSPCARGIALGNAYLSVVDDATAGWWNPAALERVDGMASNFTHRQHFMGIRYEWIGLSSRSGSNAYGIGGGGVFINGIEHRSEQQDSLGEYSAYSFLGGFSYARTLAEGLNIGTTIKGIHQRIYIYELSGWLVDFGVIYRAYPGLWIGGTLVNLGRYPKFEEEEIKPPRGWKFGASYKVEELLFSLDIEKYIDAVLGAGVGIEYELISSLFLRVGCIGGYYRARQLTGGFGIKWGEFGIDYAYRGYGYGLESAHIFTLKR